MKTTKLRKKRSMQLLRECWSFLTCQNLQNKLLNITVLFIWYLFASLKKMSLAKHGELYFILASNCFSPLAILASVWKKWFPTLICVHFVVVSICLFCWSQHMFYFTIATFKSKQTKMTTILYIIKLIVLYY